MTEDSRAGYAPHPMRRQDRALGRAEALRIARAAPFGVLSYADAACGAPMGAPLSPAVTDDGTVYWHSVCEGGARQKGLESDARASMTFVAWCEDIGDEYSTDYASAVISGRVHLVEDERERHRAAMLICERHAGPGREETSEKYWAGAGKRISLWRLDPEVISAKSRSWEKISAKLAERGF